MPPHTTEDSSIRSQEAVFQCLLEVACLPRLLLCDYLMQILSGVNGNFVTTVAVVDSKVAQSLVDSSGLSVIVIARLEVEYGGMSVLHAYSPSLHGRGSVHEAFILAVGRVLESQYCQ